MRTPSSSGSRIGAAFAVALVAALAAASGPARAEGGRAAPTSSTCRICHTDPVFGAAFSHRGLEESADGCMTCHADPAAHMKARGGRGTIAVPAGRDLCLQCHEEEAYATPKHLAPEGKDAACSACHTLHGGAMPSRTAAKPRVEEKPAVPVPAPMRLSGRVEAGWRLVDGEEGRYAQDVNLDDGPRLFGLDLAASSEDPLAPRAELSLDGLGDPHTAGRFRARKGDLWKATVDARRDEFPFLGQNGLHGGETRRERLSADLDLRLSSVARLGLGYDHAAVEGDIRGTVLSNGVLLPAAVRQDRVSEEGEATLDLRGKSWHAKVRQGWLSEEGTDGRDRDRSGPGAPDAVSFDDDSTMDGPITFVVLGGEALDGRLSLEARASRADLTREVDTTEVRRGDLAGPFTQRSSTTGSRDRLVDSQSLDAALTLGPAWAVVATFDRRTLREDGTVAARSATTTSAGTTVTSSTAADRVSQRTLTESAGVRRTLGKDFHLRAGAEWIQDRLDHFDAAAGGRVRSTGLFAGAEGPLTEEIRVHGEVRTARGSGVFTPLTPTDRDALKVGAAWRDADGTRAGIEWGLSDLRSAGGSAASRGWDFRVWGGLGREEETTFDAGWTVRNLTLSVDTLSFIGSTLVPGESVGSIRSHVLDFGLSVPLSTRLRFTVGGVFAIDQGTLPVRAFDATVGLRWRISHAFAARIEFRRREYDELGADALDYEANIIEISVEATF